MSVKFAFCSSGRFGAKVLAKLITKYNCKPSMLFTLPDKEGGRGYKLLPTEVKRCAQNFGLVVSDVDKKDLLVEIARDNELVITCDFGLIFPKEAVRRGNCINIHPSLLPRWRGPAPIFWTLRSGDKVSGVTLFLMDEGVDTGNVLCCREVEVNENMNYLDLEDYLSEVAVDILINDFCFDLSITPSLQKGESTYARKVRKDDLKVDWNLPSWDIKNLVRAASPYWGAWTIVSGKRLKIFSVSLAKLKVENVGGGKVLGYDKEKGILVSCGEGAVYLLELQLEGKRRVNFREFWNGYNFWLKDVIFE